MNASNHFFSKIKLRPEALLNFAGGQRLPVIIQTEMAECGLACLAMICGFYGHETDLISLRRKFAISSHGASLKFIMSIAPKLHLAPRAIRCELQNLSQLSLPCILHWGMNHFVVLKKITGQHFIIHDPAVGERRIGDKEFNQQFTGVALELLPTRDFKQEDETNNLKLSDFWSKIAGLKRSIVQVVLLSFLLQLFSLANPFYMQTVVDDVLLRLDTNLLLVLALGFGLLLIIQLATSALREYVILYLSNRMGIQMSANLFRHLIRLPMDYFSKRHMGDIVSRFGSIGAIRKALTATLVTAVVDGVMALLTLLAMFLYDIKLTLIVLLVVALYALLRWTTYKPFRRLSEESIIASAKESSHFMESIRAIQTIKLFQRENDRQQQWQHKLANSMNKGIEISKWNIGYSTLNGLLFGIENLVVIYFAATAVMGNVISLGMLYAFMAYKGRFVSSMDSLITQWMEFKMLNLHFSRLADVVLTEPEKIDDQEHFSVNDVLQHSQQLITGKIEVKDLGYRFSEQEPWIFRNLNFVIHPQETVAITGPSGCGKTTLMKCLMGLIEPTEGQILIDDVPLNQFKSYRSQIAAVMQEDQLMSGDIAENITCFDSSIEMQRVMACAQLACIHQDIEKMPMKYNTLVGDMGSSLSGGQKQRVILARAFYRQPKILFMDEATSHLDVAGEAAVNSNIQHLPITRILIAHRPETVASAGRQINLVNHGG
ncbi:MAG: peptidase domain-containing ABC transporter [Cellvibrio sp.]|nr:peptidase domain-containing ABC transporter [Cellvibrio sp.]